MARFDIAGEGRPTRSYRLQTDAVIIGRVDTADLVLPETGVSRKHALVAREGDTWVISDSGSANGTTINGSAAERHELKHGDVVSIGGFTLTFLTDDADFPDYTDPRMGGGEYVTSPGVPIGELGTIQKGARVGPASVVSAAIAPVPGAHGSPALEGKDGARHEVGSGLSFGQHLRVSGVLPFLNAGELQPEGPRTVAVRGSFLIPMYVNGRSVVRHVLSDGDEVRVGSTIFTYRGA
ncbi:MAG: FHA domain-containing protein [Myxococcales bacterium]|nr:FHA domain-containing protein [Myxococcales bacterium]